MLNNSIAITFIQINEIHSINFTDKPNPQGNEGDTEA